MNVKVLSKFLRLCHGSKWQFLGYVNIIANFEVMWIKPLLLGIFFIRL